MTRQEEVEISMNGKKYQAKVKALLNIPNVVDAGKVYNLKKLIGMYPYIDFNNREYFETVYDCNDFAVGDKVKFIGKVPRYSYETNYHISSKVEYTVTKVTPHTRVDKVYFYYTIKDNESGYIFDVKEKELAKAETRWIISFSSKKDEREKPDIHYLNFYGFHKIKGTWKEMFTFDSLEDATMASEILADVGLVELINFYNLHHIDAKESGIGKEVEI